MLHRRCLLLLRLSGNNTRRCYSFLNKIDRGEGGIVEVRLNHGPVNALNLGVLREFKEVMEELSSNSKDVKAVVFTGAGKCFSAGLDLKAVREYTTAQHLEMAETVNQMMATLYGLPFPTIAAVHGHAMGGGACLPVACDYRIFANGNFMYGLAEVKAGLVFPAGPMEILKRELSPNAQRVLVLTGKNILPPEALALGVCDELVEADKLDETAMAKAKEFASYRGYALIKKQLRAGSTMKALKRIVEERDDPLLQGHVKWSGF